MISRAENSEQNDDKTNNLDDVILRYNKIRHVGYDNLISFDSSSEQQIETRSGDNSGCGSSTV